MIQAPAAEKIGWVACEKRYVTIPPATEQVTYSVNFVRAELIDELPARAIQRMTGGITIRRFRDHTM